MRRKKAATYPGIHNDKYGGMTALGSIIKDAWVFELIPETQTCEGWNMAGLEALQDKILDAKQKYGFSIRHYPPEIRERYDRIQAQAIKTAREKGWNPDADLADEA